MSKQKCLVIVGCVVSAILLAAILWRLDWAVFASQLRRLHYAWLVAAMALVAFGIVLRSVRWTLAAGASPAAFPSFWSAAVIGLAFNNIYPLRAGEVVRMFVVSKLASMPLGRAATSAVIDRVADMLLLGACALVVAAAHTGLPHAEKLAAGALGVGVFLVAVLIVLARGDHVWRSSFGRWSRFVSPRLLERIQGLYVTAVETSRMAASPMRLAGLLTISAAAFAIDSTIILCVMKAFGWQLPWLAPLTVIVFLAIGTALPSAPAYAGVYQVACVLALALFDIGESSAVAFSVVCQVCMIATVVLLASLVTVGHRDALRLARGALAKQ
jgi:glycosyltransferase 2 family protein